MGKITETSPFDISETCAEIRSGRIENDRGTETGTHKGSMWARTGQGSIGAGDEIGRVGEFGCK